MLSGTRIARKMDVNRLASAVKRPGIDTRCWTSLAVALGDSVVDEDHGVFVDVMLVPTEEEYTARVPAIYAGSGFGLYSKIRKDDEIAVLVPSGNPAEGLVAVTRLWSAADKPPQQAIDDPEEVMLVVEPDKNLRLAVSGQGNVQIDCESTVIVNCQDVRFGGDDPGDEVTINELVKQELQVHVDAFNKHGHNTTATVGPSAAPGLVSAPIPTATGVPPTSTVFPPPQDMSSAIIRSD